jgi:hypothetical protein
MTIPLTLLTNNIIHDTINLIIDARDVNITPVVIIVVIALKPEIVTIRLISLILYTRNLIAVYENI